MKKFLFLLTLFLMYGTSFSQREVNMFFLENVHQSTYFNPATIPEHKLSIGLPVISSTYIEFLNPSFAFEHTNNGSKWTYSELVDRMDDRNLTGLSMYTDLFSIRFKAGRHYYSFSNTLKSDIGFSYPGDMFRLALYGNSSQSEFDFSGLGFNANIYTEHAIGMTFDAGKWTYGGRLKLLNGLANMNVRNNEFTFKNNQDPNSNYDFSIDQDISILVTGLPFEINLDSLKDGAGLYDNEGNEVDGEEIADAYSGRPLKNIGVGIDFGVHYHYNDKIDLYGSVIDLGFIRWKENTYEYNADFDFLFEGLDLELIPLVEDSAGYADSVFAQLEDSLLASLELTSKSRKYTTSPILRLNVGGKYKIWDRTHVDALLNLAIYQGVRASFTLGVYQEIKRFLNISLTNTVQYNRLFNLGLGIVIKPGPFQFYFAADNISSLFYLENDTSDRASFPIPYKMNQFNFRFGMNLVFGRVVNQSSLQNIVE